MVTSDSYTWRPLWWAISLAGVVAAQLLFLDFVEICRGGAICDARGFLSVFGPLGWLLFLGFAIVLILRMIFALVNLQFRRMLSLACAVVAIPVVLNAVRIIFDPYYWYVVLNQSHFEIKVRAETHT